MSDPRQSLDGKPVLLTGGTSGIGRALLRLLAAEGARVLTLGRDPEALEAALADARGGGGEVHGIVADLGRREDIARIFAAVDDRLGGLDILVSDAGLGAEPIDEMADDDWRAVVDVNLAAPLACARGALERFGGDGGHILIVGSISAHVHAPGESVYSATKAGLQAFALTLRKEVAARGVRVSLIEPGATGTAMQEASPAEQREQIAAHHMLPAEEVAKAMLFILSRPSGVDVVSMRIEPRVQEPS